MRPSSGDRRSRPVLPGRAQPGPTLRRGASSSGSPRPGSTAGRAARRSRRSGPTCASTPPRPRPRRAGFRACRRCRPDATPGSPEWDRAGRPRRPGHAPDRRRRRRPRRRGRAGRPARLQRAPPEPPADVAEVGAGPIALARAQRAQTARMLIETTDLPFTDVAFAAGFSSIRQFNDTVREVFARTPTELRRGAAARRRGAGPGTISRAARRPRAVRRRRRDRRSSAARAIPGIEEVVGGDLPPHAALPHGARRPSSCARRPARARHACASTTCATWPPRCPLPPPARPRRRPGGRGRALGADPVLQPLVRSGARPCACPAPPTASSWRCAPILGQQVSVAGARTLAGRLVVAVGAAAVRSRRRADPCVPPTRGAGRGSRRRVHHPGRRPRVPAGVAAAVADGRLDLDPGSDRDESAPPARGPPRDRPVDRELRRHAGAGRSRRLPADRSRRPPRARAPRDVERAGGGGGCGGAVVAVALVRTSCTCGARSRRWRRPPDDPPMAPGAGSSVSGHERRPHRAGRDRRPRHRGRTRAEPAPQQEGRCCHRPVKEVLGADKILEIEPKANGFGTEPAEAGGLARAWAAWRCRDRPDVRHRGPRRRSSASSGRPSPASTPRPTTSAARRRPW